MIGALLLTAVTPANTPTLELFAPFVGSCWAANFTPTVRDTHCFERMYDGAHVRDRHEVREDGKAVYAGETIYSADGGGLVFTYFNSLGGVGRGSITASAPRAPLQGIDAILSRQATADNRFRMANC